MDKKKLTQSRGARIVGALCRAFDLTPVGLFRGPAQLRPINRLTAATVIPAGWIRTDPGGTHRKRQQEAHWLSL